MVAAIVVGVVLVLLLGPMAVYDRRQRRRGRRVMEGPQYSRWDEGRRAEGSFGHGGEGGFCGG